MVSVLLFLAAAIWIGALVAAVIVVIAARKTLSKAAQVEFFQALGRGYLRVIGASGAVMLLLGAWELRERPIDTAMQVLIASTIVLVVSLVVGVIQARRMTRLRRAVLAGSGDRNSANGGGAVAVARGARRAALLRAVIGLASFAVVIQGALLLIE